jgi:hypothetical protein
VLYSPFLVAELEWTSIRFLQLNSFQWNDELDAQNTELLIGAAGGEERKSRRRSGTTRCASTKGAIGSSLQWMQKLSRTFYLKDLGRTMQCKNQLGRLVANIVSRELKGFKESRSHNAMQKSTRTFGG